MMDRVFKPAVKTGAVALAAFCASFCVAFSVLVVISETTVQKPTSLFGYASIMVCLGQLIPLSFWLLWNLNVKRIWFQQQGVRVERYLFRPIVLPYSHFIYLENGFFVFRRFVFHAYQYANLRELQSMFVEANDRKLLSLQPKPKKRNKMGTALYIIVISVIVALLLCAAIAGFIKTFSDPLSALYPFVAIPAGLVLMSANFILYRNRKLTF